MNKWSFVLCLDTTAWRFIGSKSEKALFIHYKDRPFMPLGQGFKSVITKYFYDKQAGSFV